MKITYLGIILVFLLIAISYTKPVQAESNNLVQIQNIQVQPSTIKVGDPIRITATLVNNSTVPIFVSDMINHDCQGPFFTVSFDNHVKVAPAADDGMTCSYVGLQERLDPDKQYTGTSPGLFFTYTATQSGTANATVTFPYEVKNQTDPNQSNIDLAISKSFLFTIYDNNTDISIPHHGGPPIPSSDFLTPLKQFKSGVTTQNIVCKEGFVLAIKKQGHQPACVSPDAIPKLVLRGWSENPLNELLLKYGNQTQANLVFYDVMNEPKIRDWSMKGWRYSDYSYASNGETHQSSATIHLYLPSNVGAHQCENGSIGTVVINLNPVEIEHNYTEVTCEIDTITIMDPDSIGK